MKSRAQQVLQFRTHGGARRDAGRKQVNARKSEPHRERAYLSPNHPVHVTVRVTRDVGRLRRRTCYHALRRALQTVLDRADFRVVHLSIQSTHVHFLVEADTSAALAKGMQSLQISAARKLNAALGRRGSVFVDRYHPVVITTPRQARHALAYVLNNWRRHREPGAGPLDPYSSAL